MPRRVSTSLLEFHSSSGRLIGTFYLLSRDKRLEKRLRCRSAGSIKEIEHDVVRKPLHIFRHHALGGCL